jgi:histidinol-phosphate/aromatic aminotransferase/cobyric acid decarboxylase-like protein
MESLRGEKYYIYNLPQPEERNPDIPKCRITLETREEVQAFLDAIARMNKEKK